MKNIYILILGMAAVFGLSACQDETEYLPPQYPIEVTDSTIVDDDCLVVEVLENNASTRAAYSGFSSTLETGDEIGIYAWNGTTVISSNVKFTRQSDGSWTPASKVPYNASYTYCAYFPYRSDHGYTPATSGTVDARFSTFIADPSNKFWTTDQSTKANFTYANLCIGQGTHVGSGNRVTFSLGHKRGLAVFTEDAADATFTGNLPYLMNNTKYFLMKPSTSTSFTDNEGTYFLSASIGKYVLHSVSLYSVDLGLSSRTKWAKGNIVSDGNGGYKVGEETDLGAYFSWGNVDPHFSSNVTTFDDRYNWGAQNTTSPYAGSAGASISFTSRSRSRDYDANTTNDAARACLGGNWKVPTATQFSELYNSTDKEYVGNFNGVSGWKFMKKTDHSVYVFLRTGGFGQNTIVNYNGRGYYWSSSLYSNDNGYVFYFTGSEVTPNDNKIRCNGCLVRAVR